MKKVFLTMLLGIAMMIPGFVRADEPLRIAATLSSYADIAKIIGGDFVEVSFIVPPKLNPHTIEPRPSDVLKVKRADLFIHSGLDLEAWREPLVNAAARAELRPGGWRELDLSNGIRLLEVPTKPLSRAEGDIHLFGNPHYWIDPRNGLIIARTIAGKLAAMDPPHSGTYHANLDLFANRLEEKLAMWRRELESVRGAVLFGHHNEWTYFVDFAGVTMDAFLEPKPGIPPGPRHLELLIESVKARNVRAVVRATYNSSDAAELISERTGIPTVTLAQNVGELPETRDYVSLIEFNVHQLAEALR